MSTSFFMIVVYLCFSGSFTVFQVLLSYEKDGSKAYDEWLSWQSLGLVVFKTSKFVAWWVCVVYCLPKYNCLWL